MHPELAALTDMNYLCTASFMPHPAFEQREVMEAWKRVRSRENKRQVRLREGEAARKKAKDEGDLILEESILEMQQAKINTKRASQKNLPIASAIH